jgi:hypothetical protein
MSLLGASPCTLRAVRVSLATVAYSADLTMFTILLWRLWSQLSGAWRPNSRGPHARGIPFQPSGERLWLWEVIPVVDTQTTSTKATMPEVSTSRMLGLPVLLNASAVGAVTWSAIVKPAGGWWAPRCNHATTVLGTKIVIAGGLASSASNDVWVSTDSYGSYALCICVCHRVSL